MGTGSSGTSMVPWPPTVTVTRRNGGQASAGLNCNTRAPSQFQAPGVEGVMVTKRCALSSGPPRCGPVSLLKNTVTGSQSRKNLSGITRTPSARIGPAASTNAARTGKHKRIKVFASFFKKKFFFEKKNQKTFIHFAEITALVLVTGVIL